MKKEDYMKLSKERLAELLEERDRIDYSSGNIVFSDPRPLCGLGGYCTNPHFDCIGCPGRYHSGIKYTTNNFNTSDL